MITKYGVRIGGTLIQLSTAAGVEMKINTKNDKRLKKNYLIILDLEYCRFYQMRSYAQNDLLIIKG